MTNSIESAKNYLQWNKADWRAYFRTHNPRIKNDYDNVPSDIRALIFQPEFQEQMIKVGVFGNTKIYDQIPSRWSIEINPTPATLIDSSWGGGPKDFTRVTSVVTHLILHHEDGDEGMLIKLPGQKEPLYLVKQGSRQLWDVQTHRSTRYSIIWRLEEFEAAAEVVELAQARGILENDFLQNPVLVPALWKLVGSYVSDTHLTLDPDAQQKRKTRQHLTKALDDALNRPMGLFPRATQIDACNIVSAVLADSYLEEAPENEIDGSWASTFSQICSSLCDKLTSFIRWCLSFFL